MSYLFAPHETVSSPVVGTDERFPIGRIFCVGRNYAAHAREMGADPDRELPFFFIKDADAYVGDGATVPYPPETSNYHHEIELVVAIGKEGLKVSQDEAASMIFGYAVGLDMTRRDLQLEARKVGRPWCTAKNFPRAAPMGPIHRLADTGELTTGAISLTVNGKTTQASDLSLLIWNVRETISFLSRFYRLQPGDLIFTGTPEGVGPVVPRDVMVGNIDRLGSLTITIGEAEA